MAGSTRRSFTQAAILGRVKATTALAAVGAQLRVARRRRGWTQRQLAAKAGIDHTRASQLERGKGAGAPADTWFALAEALGISFRMEFGRDLLQALEDAGHLEMQEFMLGLARAQGAARTFELATRPANPAHSVDVGVRDDARRLLVLEECWNTFDNIGASVRSTRRKLAEAEALAVAVGGEAGPYRVAGVWVVRGTPPNREVLARYPEVIEATFTGDSSTWVRALTLGEAPPHELGLVLWDPRQRRLRAWRRR